MQKKIGIRQLPEGNHDGYKPVTKKCLYNGNQLCRDTLLEIAMMCQENSLVDFVGNQQDFATLIREDTLSPTIREFMDNCFVQTKYTK